MPVKCSKCGADIPEGATFCPACGSPVSTMQQQQPFTQQKAKPSGQDSIKGLADTVFSKFIIMLGVCIGVLIAWIGKILTTFYIGTAANAGNVLHSIGFAGVGLLLFGGGFLNKDIDKYVRMGMVIIGGFILVYSLTPLSFSFNIPTNLPYGY